MVTESVGNLEKGAWVQFRPEGIMYQITEIGKTRATLVDGEGNISTIPLRQAVYPLEAKPPAVEVKAVPLFGIKTNLPSMGAAIGELTQRGYMKSVPAEPQTLEDALKLLPRETTMEEGRIITISLMSPAGITKRQATEIERLTEKLRREVNETVIKPIQKANSETLERFSELVPEVDRLRLAQAEGNLNEKGLARLRELRGNPQPTAVPQVLPTKAIFEVVPKTETVPEEKLPSDHELLLHFGIEEVGSPGVVLDEARARATPCSCFTYKGKDLCWSKGIIGLMTQEQQDVYCVAGKAYKAQPKLVERYTTFAEAAEEAHKRIEAMPKGRERLMAWLAAMGEELSKRAIEV